MNSSTLPLQAERRLAELQAALLPLRTQAQRHSLYDRLRSLTDVQRFMEQHVFAVWDFMSLLKWLQRHLTCVEVPWHFTADPLSRRLINEIVLAEESDTDGQGGYASHLELYLAAMGQCGADQVPLATFQQEIGSGQGVHEALQTAQVPTGAANFVQGTFELLSAGVPHAIAAGFALGREDVIPGMFREIIQDLDARLPGKLTLFRDYLQRHVELNEEHHTPLALRMLCQLCGNDPARWNEAEAGAKNCLQQRIALWDAIEVTLD